ncbi:MAG: branched-chain amino acid ABC transporter permease [Alphaproteobacteria bacterium]|nr:branched-chain amino acid ABC transporter permease [Alphaproteobacteria bacterium]
MFAPLAPQGRAAVALLVAVLLILPLVWHDTYALHLIILSMIFGAFAVAWNFTTGYAGLKTFGHHAFFGIGAYFSALISKNLEISPWLTTPAAGLVAAAAGLVVALPVLRIRSVPHVAMVTLGFAEIVRVLLTVFRETTRGEMGLWGIPAYDGFTIPGLGEIAFNAAEKVPYYYLAAFLFLGSVYAVVRMVKSPIGLALVAIRDSQDAAESLGISLTRYKLLAFSTSAFMVGLLGAFYAHYILLLTPSSVLGLDLMIYIIGITLIGGVGTLFGPIIGAFVLTIGIEAMRGIGEYRMLIYGALIIVVVMFMPRGLVALLDRLGPRMGFGRGVALATSDDAAKAG